MMNQESVDRREFAKRLVAGTAAIPLSGTTASLAIAAEQQTPKENKSSQENRAEGASDRISTAVLLLEIVRRQYPDKRLDERVLGAIYGEIRSNLIRSRVMNRYPLKNSDEPAPVFAAFRSPVEESQ